MLTMPQKPASRSTSAAMPMTTPLATRRARPAGRQPFLGAGIGSRAASAKLELRPTAEAADPALVVGDRGLEVVDPEVGPQRLRHVKLRVRGLPEQEVAHSPLTGGPDYEVGVGQPGL